MSQDDQQQNHDQPDDTSGWMQWLWEELISSPINVVLVLCIAYMLYKLLKPEASPDTSGPAPQPDLPPMKRRDFTLEELRQYDGHGPDGRVLMAVDGQVYDVSKGKRFYGPGGHYSNFAGRDASRGLATFNAECVSDTYDDLSDLKPYELEQVKEWAEQIGERYVLVGKLLKPNEEPTVYSDDEEEGAAEDEVDSSGQTGPSSATKTDPPTQ